jgi:uncharacterized membrane protein
MLLSLPGTRGTTMTKGRLEAFSDGVLAIILTIMVLELKVPHGADLHALLPLCPVFFSYVVSFVYIGIYWNNHHHMLHATKKVSGGILWANLHLLFWLSLIPVVTGWVGHEPEASWPAAAYGVVLFASGVAWLVLQGAIIRRNGGADSELARAVGRDLKGKTSAVCYLAAIGLAFVKPWLADGIYMLVAGIWLVPDRRIEAQLSEEEK